MIMLLGVEQSKVQDWQPNNQRLNRWVSRAMKCRAMKCRLNLRSNGTVFILLIFYWVAGT